MKEDNNQTVMMDAFKGKTFLVIRHIPGTTSAKQGIVSTFFSYNIGRFKTEQALIEEGGCWFGFTNKYGLFDLGVSSDADLKRVMNTFIIKEKMQCRIM